MGASGNVDLQFTASDQAAQQAWRSQQRMADALLKRLEKIDQLTKKSGSGMQVPGLGSLPGELKSLAASMVTIATVVRQVRVEAEAILQERSGAAFEQVQYRRAVGNALRNSGNLFENPQALDKYIADTARQSRQKRWKVAQLVDSGLSAQGAATPEDLKSVQETMTETLLTYPELGVEETKTVLQAAQDIRSKNPGMTAREAVGYNLKMGQMARVVDPMEQAKNLSPIAANLMSYNMSLQESGALVATVSHGMKDWTGETSGMAALKFAGELAERLPDLKSFSERLAAFRANPAWQEAYFHGGMINGQKFNQAEIGRGKAEPTIKALFDPNSADSRRMVEFQQEFGTFESLGKFTAQHQKDIQQLAGSKIEEIQRVGEAIKEDIRLENTRGAMGAVTDEALKGILTAAGVSQLDADRMVFGLRTENVSPEDKPRVLAQKLRTMKEDIQAQSDREMRPDVATTWYGNLLTAPVKWWYGEGPTKEEQQQRADMLGDAAGKFDVLSDKYGPGKPAPNYVDQFTREEIEQYRREIRSGKQVDKRPMRSRLYDLPENSQTGKRAEKLIEDIRSRIEDGLSQEEISGLRGELKYAGHVTAGMGHNATSYLYSRELDALRGQLDAADSGALGTAGQVEERLKANGITPEGARGILPDLELARRESERLPDGERQQLQMRIDALTEAIKEMTAALQGNTEATDKNTSEAGANGAAPIGPQSSRDAMRRDGYRPVSGRLGRIS